MIVITYELYSLWRLGENFTNKYSEEHKYYHRLLDISLTSHRCYFYFSYIYKLFVSFYIFLVLFFMHLFVLRIILLILYVHRQLYTLPVSYLDAQSSNVNHSNTR